MNRKDMLFFPSKERVSHILGWLLNMLCSWGWSQEWPWIPDPPASTFWSARVIGTYLGFSVIRTPVQGVMHASKQPTNWAASLVWRNTLFKVLCQTEFGAVFVLYPWIQTRSHGIFWHRCWHECASVAGVLHCFALYLLSQGLLLNLELRQFCLVMAASLL